MSNFGTEPGQQEHPGVNDPELREAIDAPDAELVFGHPGNEPPSDEAPSTTR